MKKTNVIAFALGIALIGACKKEAKTTTTTPPPTTNTSTPTFGDGFKMTDNLGTTLISDSSVCEPNQFQQLTSYRGANNGHGLPNFELRVKHPPLKAQMYPIDSIDTQNFFMFFGGTSSQYHINSGSLTVSLLTGSKSSGTFTFGVIPALGGTDTRTLITGVFNNVKVR